MYHEDQKVTVHMRRLYQEKNILFELIGRYKSNFLKTEKMITNQFHKYREGLIIPRIDVFKLRDK